MIWRILEMLSLSVYACSTKAGRILCFHDFKDVPAKGIFGIEGDERECQKCTRTYVTSLAER